LSCSVVSSPCFAGGVDLALEGVEGDLPHHRVEHVLDLAGEHREALPRIGGLFQHRAERQHLAEHRGRFGKRQRRGAISAPCGPAST
jgi:predicted component of type VI protein secretion system